MLAHELLQVPELAPEDGGVEFITKSEPREGYLINGIGAVPEKFIEYEIFPETLSVNLHHDN